ncbi:P-loop containing nucleoside triphosphate hydrolase protein [Phellopilus nigrolimitatus]|nr:P-loop containing nucleoside triphosphate hydrolase protein [Phellopilus nigrolimitatus]
MNLQTLSKILLTDEVYLRQSWALFVKNMIVLSKHPYLNLLRCLVLPIAYGVFLALAQLFFTKPNNFGLGQPVPVASLKDKIDGSLALYWVDGTNGTGSPSPSDIMTHVTSGFSSSQLRVVHQVNSQVDIVQACPQNFNLFSECFAAVTFDALPASANDSAPLNYTIMVDGGLLHIDVVKHTSDYEERVLPLQWAIDSAIIELKTGTQTPTPLEWPFTQETNKEQFTDIRISYLRGIRELLVIALFVCYVGIAYQLPGAYVAERANLLTSHLQAMGLRDSARMMMWHFSITLIYYPAWLIVAVVWHSRIFTGTSIAIVMSVHTLLGPLLASWSFFVSAWFESSPQLAAVVSTFLAIVFAILAQAFGSASTGAAFIFSLVFPPGFYIFTIRAIVGFEVNHVKTNLLKADPDNNLIILPLIVAAVIGTGLYPVLAVFIERRLYNARQPSSSSKSSWLWSDDTNRSLPPNTAISIRNLKKTFSARPWWSWRRQDITAIVDLTLDIPKFGIFVLLGSNGAGKSTALSILAGLQGRTSGDVLYEGGTSRPPHGVLGIVPQKNVLFPELTCYQTVRLWQAIKRAEGSTDEEDLVQLLIDCDLGNKIDANAETLSGGQKRKLQLAVGLAGGSKIVLVDECTSGVDPLSRRALWRTLTSVRNERTVVFTTHFLDEADLLGDNIAILATPGKLVAEGSPVSLKSTLGEGYIVHVSLVPTYEFEKLRPGPSPELLEKIRSIAPNAYMTSPRSASASYHLKSKDSATVEKVLSLIEQEKAALGVSSYEVHGTSMENIFLELMKEHGQGVQGIQDQPEEVTSIKVEQVETKGSITSASDTPRILSLTNGRRRSPFSQAFTIFHKRCLIARRAWMTPVLSLIIAVAGSCIPLFFLSKLAQTCETTIDSHASSTIPTGSVESVGNAILTVPPNIIGTLGTSAASLLTTNVQDNTTFVAEINQNFSDLSLGGVSVDLSSGSALIAWEASPPGLTGPTMLNLATNILYNSALNSTNQGTGSPSIISPSLRNFPGVAAGTLVALKWEVFFGAAMAVFPAFYALYVSNERRSSVQAMQLSNGLADPVGLWLGHLMFDSMFSVAAATIIIIVFATVTTQLHGLGLFWVVLALYGITGALFAYCVSLVTASPLAAFAVVAGYQVIMFVLYVAAYLLTATYAKTSQAGNIITIIRVFFIYSLVFYSNVITRFHSVGSFPVNLFSLLCNGNEPDLSTGSMRAMKKFGGPITYLIIYSLVLFAFLVWFDSGTKFSTKLVSSFKKKSRTVSGVPNKGEPLKDIQEEADAVAVSSDPLRVMHVTKKYQGSMVNAVDDVSFGVSRDTVLALLGPNGAGKTSTFNIIRGDVIPEQGDVLIKGTSVVRNPRTARISLGVCPQFTAIDSQLNVREHLLIYGRLKGLYRGAELDRNIDILLDATALAPYAGRLASKLSGGNQRKLSLAIALIGNPPVILIDEFSTGVDAKMKRDMWETLRNVAIGKAVVITTHSMEEASALANKVGIISGRLLVVGSTHSLAARYPIYEIHFSCHDQTQTLASLFRTLSEYGDFSDYTVEKVSLESVFLKVVRENGVEEEDFAARSGKKRWFDRNC